MREPVAQDPDSQAQPTGPRGHSERGHPEGGHPERGPSPFEALPPWAARLLALLTGLSLACLAAALFLSFRLVRGNGAAATEQTRREAVREMAAEHGGLYDAHPDADVRRLLTAELRGFEHRGVAVDTNRIGLRERDFEMPKPEGVVRIVLLGDSMVYGWGAEAEDRVGVHLERFLGARAGLNGAVEVLHVGVPSWNIHNQTHFLRRRLSLIQPDLVVHVLVPNDIEDDNGVRGFGAAASFSPRHRRADALLHAYVPLELLPDAEPSLLRLGLDFESQQRYDALRRQVVSLAALLERSGIAYRTLFHFRRLGAIAWDQAGQELEQALGFETFYTSIDFGDDESLRVAPDDAHWNRQGHELMARVFYELIRRHRLLPSFDLPDWPEARETFEDIAGTGRREASKPGKAGRLRARHADGVRSQLDFAALDARGASQVHGGIDREGLLMPYASLLLLRGGDELRLLAEPLPRPELEGASVAISADGEPVGVIEIGTSTIDRRFEIPSRLAARPVLTIRFEASDFVHTGDDLRQGRVLRLRRVAVQ